MASLPSHFVLPTVRVDAPGGGFLVINEADFDPDAHKRWAGNIKAEPEPQPLKPGFRLESLGLTPGAVKALEREGLTTAEAIIKRAEADDDWNQDISGIGTTSARLVVEAAREHLEG